MALVNNQLVINDLDFDSVKQNFINWLAGQDQFSDYNFSGAGLQILLDILAYNTHYNGFYYNMMSNELTISTSQILDNIVKHANMLNYLPRSMTSSQATVNIIITPSSSNNNPSLLTLPAYTPFISQSVNGSNFNFVTTEAYVATYTGSNYVFNNVNINEGNIVNYNYNASLASGNTFNIPNANIDTTTLIVTVTETANVIPQIYPYTLCQDISLLNGNSRVFFLSGADNSTYNLQFGDNILGRQLNGGDTVALTYLNTNGPAANFANSFTIMNPISNYSNVIVQSVSAAAGGALSESPTSIKYHAPISYSTQNRALTLTDYNEVLLRNYTNIASLNIWDGKNNNPPVFGQIMISIKPPLYDYLSNTQKQTVINLLQEYNMPTIGITMVDPDYTYLMVNVEVNYNPNATLLDEASLITNITNAILNYSANQLSSFTSTFRESVFDQNIALVDPSILGVDTEITLQKRIVPTLSTPQNYTLNYHTSLKQGSLTENIFSSPAFTAYDSTGNLQTCYIQENISAYNNISAIIINNPGFGFTGQPDLIIQGDGTGCTGHVIIVNGSIDSVIIDNPGINYTFAEVIVSGGGGYNAVLTPILAASTGQLQTYYITNSNKFILNTNQGTIDYTNGIIVLNNFNPISILNASGQLSINAPPLRSLILPDKNNILMIDPNDPSAVQISLVPQIS